MNKTVIPRYPVVPNPHTLLSPIPVDFQYFSVIDLCDVLFSIPVGKDSQYLFVFTWEDNQLTWTVMSQRYTESTYLISSRNPGY